MNLDSLAALLCGWMAVCVFGLHIVSSPKRKHWMTLPEYVRRGLVVTGTMFVWRSVNLATLAPSPPEWGPGHINVEGVMAALAMTYMVTSLVVWAWRRHLPGKGWDRAAWVEHELAGSEAKVAVVMTQRELEDHARGEGFTVNAKPPEKLS